MNLSILKELEIDLLPAENKERTLCGFMKWYQNKIHGRFISADEYCRIIEKFKK
jgi:hypothetical protein